MLERVIFERIRSVKRWIKIPKSTGSSSYSVGWEWSTDFTDPQAIAVDF
jgi:hypothetical protein